MNTSKSLLLIPLFFLLFMLGCEDEETVMPPFEQPILNSNDGSLVYTAANSYPMVGTITGTTPTFSSELPYRFRLIEVSSPTNSSYTLNSFSIDLDTGVISYNNTNNTISSGTYSIDVGVSNINGLAIHQDVFNLTVLDVPVTLSADNTTVNAGIFQQGVVATVSYSDTSTDGVVSSVEYALIDPPAGFKIDKITGEISKESGAVSGDNFLSVEVTTNVGKVAVTNLVNIIVGDPPTIELFKNGTTTALSKVVLYPYSAYTTAAPVVDGMAPTSWEIIFPKSLVNNQPDVAAGEEAIDYSNFFSVEDATGKVTVAADADLPLGVHILSLKATNATDSEFTFDDVLTLEVELRWETTPVYENDFSAGAGTQITFPSLNGASSAFVHVSNHGKIAKPALKYQWTNATTDAAVELKIPVEGTDIKKLRVSFWEAFGYGAVIIDRYNKSLAQYLSTDGTNSLDTSTWTDVMGVSDSSWSTAPQWGALSAANPDAFNMVSGKLVQVAPDTKTVYLYWRFFRKDGAAHNNGQYLLRNFFIEGAKAFPAEEQ